MDNNLETRQSTLIKAMRFPLIVLVVFAHSVGTFPAPTVNWSLDGWNVYHFISEMLSRHICSIGTCWFFVFSGYLMYYYLKEEDFGMPWVLRKWKKRVRSLLIPYLFWNLLAVLLAVIKNGACGLLSIGEVSPNWWNELGSPLYWLWSGPADFPLWFMRDLMILTLISPLMYVVFKRFPRLSLLALVIVYLSPLDPHIPTMRSIFFFSIGVWLGTTKSLVLSVCRKTYRPAMAGAAILALLATSQIGRPMHTLLLRLFYPCGMIVFMNLCDKMINSERVRDRLCALSGSVFFIYAAHEIYILGWTKGLFLRIFGNSLAGTWVSYLMVPVVVIAVCLGLYFLLNRIMPRTMAFACGGRTKKTLPCESLSR